MGNRSEQEFHYYQYSDNMFEYAREALVNAALRYIGKVSVNYVANNMDPKSGMNPEEGFDCSGFVTFLLRQIGFPFPDVIRLHSSEFFDSFGTFVQLGCQKRGDLVFFTRDGLCPTHLGIMISPDKYVHAPGKDNSFVTIKTLQLVGIAPIEGQSYNVNPIGFKRLAIEGDRWRNVVK